MQRNEPGVGHHVGLQVIDALLFGFIFDAESPVVLTQHLVVHRQLAVVVKEVVDGNFEALELLVLSDKQLLLVEQPLVLQLEIVDDVRVVAELVETAIGGAGDDFDDFGALLLGAFVGARKRAGGGEKSETGYTPWRNAPWRHLRRRRRLAGDVHGSIQARMRKH